MISYIFETKNQGCSKYHYISSVRILKRTSFLTKSMLKRPYTPVRIPSLDDSIEYFRDQDINRSVHDYTFGKQPRTPCFK